MTPEEQAARDAAPMKCSGCGSRQTLDEIRAMGFVSCCPDRSMHPSEADHARFADEMATCIERLVRIDLIQRDGAAAQTAAAYRAALAGAPAP